MQKQQSPVSLSPWKILIIDRDQVIHDATRNSLAQASFKDRPLEYFHASSLDAGREILNQHPDIALLLLESLSDNGDELSLANYIRRDCGNQLMRIVLLAEQLDPALEEKIIAHDEINDYRLKTNLSPHQLYITVVTALRAHQHEYDLLDEKEKMRITLQSINDAVISTDPQGNVNFMNRAAERLTGRKNDEVCNQSLDTLFTLQDPTSHQPIRDLIAGTRCEGGPRDLGSRLILERADGENTIVTGTITPIIGSHDTICGTVLVLHDNTLNESMEELLSWQQTHDNLTELINRREFEKHLQQALDDTLLHDKQAYLLYIDINDFRMINDACGHMAGDKLLIELAQRLKNIIHEPNLLSRMGGDEFGILLPGVDEDQATEYANRVLDMLEEYTFFWSKESYSVTASIGMVPLKMNCENISCILSAVDIACKAAKETMGNSLSVYQYSNEELVKRVHELSWANRLTRALRGNEFELVCQQIAPLHEVNGHPFHCEILVRLRNLEGANLTPNNFIPAAEKYNLMPRIDRWIINTTMQALAQWRKDTAGAHDMLCSINLSGNSLSDHKLIDFIRETFDKHDFPAEQICFEITETAAIKHIGQATALIEQIKALGCKFALDDFGSGLSSFTYLRELPVDYLKIDGHFVRDMHMDPVNYAMVDTINQMGKTMGIQTIAERVENQDILDKIKTLDIDFIQGYVVARPQPLAEVLDSIH